MRSASALGLPPPPIRPDSRPLEPNEQWKADLRRSIEFAFRHMVEDAQNVRDTILNSQSSESSRERAHREYEESMNNIRMLAQEEFNRGLRIEMSERKWALDVVDSNSPDVARQQQWILDNIRKADDDLNHMPFADPDAPQNPEGVPSASPQEQGNSERASDESLEGGYGGTITEDGWDQSMEGEGEGVQPRQSRPTSRPNVSLTQTLRSRSPVSRRDAQSRWGQPPNLRSAEDHDEDTGDSPEPAHPAPPRESQPFPPGGPPRRQSSSPPIWSRVATPSRPTGISRASDHANGQMYSPSPVQFPRRGSVNSTGSNSSGAGLHRAGSLNSDQHRSGSVAPHNPHNGTERQSLEDAKRLEEGARQVEPSAKMREAAAQKREAEAKLKEAEAQKREAAAQKREAEAQRKEEMARQMEHAARRKEEQARWKEEARKREDEARKREEYAREREKLARQKEEDARRFEEEARRKEDEARRKREEAKRLEQDYEQKKREIERKEAELKIKEAELFRKEQAARLAQEELEPGCPADETSRLESEATSPIDAEEVNLGAEDAAKADPCNRTPEDSTRQDQDAESTAPGQEKQQEQERLAGQWLLEEKRLEEERLWREREEQIRLDEEISRQEQMRLHREAVIEQE